MELKCVLQTYDWGKLGENSEAALLAKAGDPNCQISADTPYAELWMGTHPNGPSLITDSNQSLQEWIVQNPQALGDKVTKQFGVQLPFLFKVLSVNKALSIQVHPSKAEAEKLFAQFPSIYKDRNHKPEMAIALSQFEALCGFRPLDEIKEFLNRIPELRICMGIENVEALKSCTEDCQKENLQRCFHALMTTPESEVSASLDSLLKRISSLDESSREQHLAELVTRLHSQFPGDVGVFGPYLFNYVVLRPGQALYLAANEPHAYLSGDCIECMACSDNTIRAGLTPKFKDVPTLCSMLTYICEPANRKLFTSLPEDQFTSTFRPPVPDFAVSKICVPSGQTFTMISRSSASITVVISGAATCQTLSIQRGSIFFLKSKESLTFQVSSSDSLLMFQAFANL